MKSTVRVQGTAVCIVSSGNDGFNCGEFAIIKSNVGLNSDTISVIFFHHDIAVEINMWNSQDSKTFEFERFRTDAGGDRLKRLNQIAIRQMQTLTPTTLRSLADSTKLEGKA